MRILFVGMPFSIHTARWIAQFENQNWDIHFFPSFEYTDTHEQLKNIVYHEHYHAFQGINKNIKIKPIYKLEINFRNKFLKNVTSKIYRLIGLELSKEKTLSKLINKLQPDIIHSLETQSAGYLVDKAYKINPFKSIWIHSIWGIDLHFYEKIQDHKNSIQSVLQKINVFLSEGQRDIEIAKKIGYSGETYVIPAGGGHNLDQIQISDFKKTSSRKLILLKGTQDICRRGLVGLRALEKCVDLLSNYEIVVYNCCQELQYAIECFIFDNPSIKISILKHTSHKNMLDLNKIARISITTNLSDGLPNSFLEAMIYGAFPIQSNTSNANEWIQVGVSGFLVPPNDPEIIEKAIRIALTDDNLVDNAALINHKLAKQKLDYKTIQNKAISIYTSALSEHKKQYK